MNKLEKCSCGAKGEVRVMPPAWYGLSLMPHQFEMIVCEECSKMYDIIEAERATRPEYQEFIKSVGWNPNK